MDTGILVLTDADREHMAKYKTEYETKEATRHPIKQLEYQNERLRDLVKALRAETVSLRTEMADLKRKERKLFAIENIGNAAHGLPCTPGGIIEERQNANRKRR
jgi:hypothetical protein